VPFSCIMMDLLAVDVWNLTSFDFDAYLKFLLSLIKELNPFVDYARNYFILDMLHLAIKINFPYFSF